MRHAAARSGEQDMDLGPVGGENVRLFGEDKGIAERHS
jgi:hypothetical protein